MLLTKVFRKGPFCSGSQVLKGTHQFTVSIGPEKKGVRVQISSLVARLGKCYFYALFTRPMPMSVGTTQVLINCSME